MKNILVCVALILAMAAPAFGFGSRKGSAPAQEPVVLAADPVEKKQGEPTGALIIHGNDSQGGLIIHYAAVPEPDVFSFLLIGLIGLGMWIKFGRLRAFKG